MKDNQNPTTSERTKTGNVITGMFRDRASADRAYNVLINKGYSKDEINIVMTEDTRKKHFADGKSSEMGNKVMEGAGKGSAIGGAVGAVAGIIAAIGTSLVIPGLGLVIAGPIAAGLAGAGAGGLTGGIIGALVNSGIPEDRAKAYEKGIKEGNIVVTVRPRNESDAQMIEREWKEYEVR
jgi:hypothetical protein